MHAHQVPGTEKAALRPQELTCMHGQLHLAHAHAEGEVPRLAALQHHELLAPGIRGEQPLLPAH